MTMVTQIFKPIAKANIKTLCSEDANANEALALSNFLKLWTAFGKALKHEVFQKSNSVRLPSFGMLYVSQIGEDPPLQIIPMNQVMTQLKIQSAQVPNYKIAGQIFQKASSPNYAKMAKIIDLKSVNPAKDAEDLIGAVFLRTLANCKNKDIQLDIGIGTITMSLHKLDFKQSNQASQLNSPTRDTSPVLSRDKQPSPFAKYSSRNKESKLSGEMLSSSPSSLTKLVTQSLPTVQAMRQLQSDEEKQFREAVRQSHDMNQKQNWENGIIGLQGAPHEGPSFERILSRKKLGQKTPEKDSSQSRLPFLSGAIMSPIQISNQKFRADIRRRYDSNQSSQLLGYSGIGMDSNVSRVNAPTKRRQQNNSQIDRAYMDLLLKSPTTSRQAYNTELAQTVSIKELGDRAQQLAQDQYRRALKGQGHIAREGFDGAPLVHTISRQPNTTMNTKTHNSPFGSQRNLIIPQNELDQKISMEQLLDRKANVLSPNRDSNAVNLSANNEHQKYLSDSFFDKQRANAQRIMQAYQHTSQVYQEKILKEWQKEERLKRSTNEMNSKHNTTRNMSNYNSIY